MLRRGSAPVAVTTRLRRDVVTTTALTAVVGAGADHACVSAGDDRQLVNVGLFRLDGGRPARQSPPR